MAEKKKGKKRKEEYIAPGEDIIEKPSKEEYKVAKWLRKNVPIKKTKFLNHNVEYFTGKAVDLLWESEWAKGDDPFFKSREDIIDFLHTMLEHKFFHRARKVPVSEEELRARKKDKKTTEAEDKKKTEEKEKDKKEKEKITDAESSVVEGKPDAPSGKEKRKRKIRLDMHNDQRFVDSLDAYVWIYDPIPVLYWVIGTLLVLGSIGICLFPLWPPSVRLGVYYLSVAAAGFLVFIIFLAVLRVIIFSIVWVCSLGRHHIWILPNLTEDVGFFASFWPLYTYQYKGPDSNSDSCKSKKIKKKKKDKDSDAEEDNNTEPKKEEEDDNSVKPNTADDDGQNENGTNVDGSPTEQLGASESESESSQRSSTGKDFEMVDQDDLES